MGRGAVQQFDAFDIVRFLSRHGIVADGVREERLARTLSMPSPCRRHREQAQEGDCRLTEDHRKNGRGDGDKSGNDWVGVIHALVSRGRFLSIAEYIGNSEFFFKGLRAISGKSSISNQA